MVLNISGGLFGDNNKLTENREFFPISKQRHIKVIGDGQNAIGFMGHYFDQKRLQAGLYRHPWDDILYDVPDKPEKVK